jgi:hypothetical protein
MQLVPGLAQNLDWAYYLRQGKAFSAIGAQTAVGGQNSHVQLWNPAASGVVLLVYNLTIATPAAGFVFGGTYNAALTTQNNQGRNLLLGGANGVCYTRTQSNAGGLPFNAKMYAVPANTNTLPPLPWICVVPQGQGLTFYHNTVNVELDLEFTWVEIAP